MIKNLIKALAVIAIVGNVILAIPGVANADDRPVVATYKDEEKHKNLVRLYEDSVQLVDVDGWKLVSARTAHLVDVGFEILPFVKTPQIFRDDDWFWLFKPIEEGKSQFNGWTVDPDVAEKVLAKLSTFYGSVKTLNTVTDPSKIDESCANSKIFKSFDKYMWEHYPEMLREAMAYNIEHSSDIKEIAEKKVSASAQGKISDVSDGFQQAYSKPLNSYIEVEDNFAWSDFLHNGVQPDIDVNWLIHNLWYVEITTTDPFGGKSEGKKFVARFAPFIWLNLGQNETPVKTLELINIYDSESGRQCLYLGEAHDYDGKSVTFDTANFIVDMTSANIPKVDAGNVHTVNMIDMNGAGLKTNQVYPEPIIFHKTTAQPESFTMESSDYAWNTKTQYRFVRIK